VTELSFDGGEGVQGDRPAWAGHLRRPALILAVAVLCAAAYLAGLWTGTNTNIACTTTGPGQIVCASDGSQLPTPVVPARPAQPPTA
jgi:hypothetical protein